MQFDKELQSDSNKIGMPQHGFDYEEEDEEDDDMDLEEEQINEMIRARFNRGHRNLANKMEKSKQDKNSMLFYEDDDDGMDVEGFDDLDDEMGDMD